MKQENRKSGSFFPKLLIFSRRWENIPAIAKIIALSEKLILLSLIFLHAWDYFGKVTKIFLAKGFFAPLTQIFLQRKDLKRITGI